MHGTIRERDFLYTTGISLIEADAAHRLIRLYKICVIALTYIFKIYPEGG